MFYDNHTHSSFSPDSHISVAESITQAQKQGLLGIAITDHLDIDAPLRECEFMFNPKEQQNEIKKVLESVNQNGNHNIEVLNGIEIGLQIDSINKIRQFIKEYTFDVVIGSVHFIEHLDPYMQTYYKEKDYKKAYEGALKAIYKTAIEYKDFDILGHYDYITRYHDYPCRSITLKDFGDYLEPLLKFLAENGKALEINTNTYKERYNGTPKLDENIIKRFKELGGECISFGSDAHVTERIGENFEYFAHIIKNCGFQHLVYYKNRKPQFYKI